MPGSKKQTARHRMLDIKHNSELAVLPACRSQFFSFLLALRQLLCYFFSGAVESGRTDADWLRGLRTHVLKEAGLLFLPVLLAFWIPAAFSLLVRFFRFGRHCLSFGLAFLTFCFSASFWIPTALLFWI